MPLTSDPDVRTELCLKLGGLLFSGSASTQRTMDSVTRLYHYLGGTGKITVLVSYDAVIVFRNQRRPAEQPDKPISFNLHGQHKGPDGDQFILAWSGPK